jgi:hypothetical protein
MAHKGRQIEPADLRQVAPRGEVPPGAFEYLGLTLALLRSLRGKKQAEVAKAAGVGKSQLSKSRLESHPAGTSTRAIWPVCRR